MALGVELSELDREAGIALLLGWVAAHVATWTGGGVVCGAALLCFACKASGSN